MEMPGTLSAFPVTIVHNEQAVCSTPKNKMAAKHPLPFRYCF